MRIRSVLLGLLGCAVVTPAFAHPGHEALHVSGLVAGFSHPWLGLDHLLAMLAVGLLSAQLGGRAVWLLPASFVGLMLLGGATGMSSGDFHLIEMGIALSVVVLGCALAAGRRYPLVIATLVIGAFGFLHGHAHGTEMPTLAAPLLYAVGFVGATAMLHLVGLACGAWVVRHEPWKLALRWSGAAISAVGVMLLLG